MYLNLEHIHKSYGTEGSGSYQQVLNDLSLQVNQGDSVAITGPSGSGKSTLLNLIGTLDRPDTGLITYRDRDINQLRGKALDDFRNKEIGFIFQQHHLLPQCTLLENVLVPTLPRKDSEDKHEHAESLIRRVGLWEHRHKKPGVLSGGECQRTAVVRALINRPGILLADEPTGALDQEHSASLFDLLRQINKENGVTLIVVTHSAALAGNMDDHYRLENGQLNPANPS